jgi:hypothetical protein
MEKMRMVISSIKFDLYETILEDSNIEDMNNIIEHLEEIAAALTEDVSDYEFENK